MKRTILVLGLTVLAACASRDKPANSVPEPEAPAPAASGTDGETPPDGSGTDGKAGTEAAPAGTAPVTNETEPSPSAVPEGSEAAKPEATEAPPPKKKKPVRL